MKANELRIGNLVMYSNNSIIFTVSGLHEFGMDCFDDIEETYIEYDQFEGIPLTEEWLLKFGFNQYETVVIKTHNYIKGNFKFNSAVLWVAEYKGIHIESKILYVHQLQNLYFALTGEELTILF
jgi:hypothetical protein